MFYEDQKKISDQNWLNSLKRQMGLKEYSDEPEKKVEKKPINENPPKQEINQTVSSNDETVTITKSELRSLYAEFTSFVKIRDDCFEQLKPLKFAKLNRLISLCETHLDIKRALTKCSYCTFEAKNLKSMAAHLRSCTHKPVLAAVSSISEQEGSEGEDEEEDEA